MLQFVLTVNLSSLTFETAINALLYVLAEQDDIVTKSECSSSGSSQRDAGRSLLRQTK